MSAKPESRGGMRDRWWFAIIVAWFSFVSTDVGQSMRVVNVYARIASTRPTTRVL